MKVLTYMGKGLFWVIYLAGCITIGVYIRLNWLTPTPPDGTPIIEEQASDDPATRNVWSDV